VAQLQRITVQLPSKPELLLERSDEGWVAMQEEFALKTADSTVFPLLQALSNIQSVRIVPNARRDTMGLDARQAIHLEATLVEGRKEMIEIGKETWEHQQPVTYIALDRHEGVYLVSGHLRKVFALTADDFRQKTVLQLPFQQLSRFQIVRPGVDTVLWQPSDTAAVWHATGLATATPLEAVQLWWQQLLTLNTLPFASHTDEGQAAEQLVMRLVLEHKEQETPVELQFFRTRAHFYRAERRKGTPPVVVQSSQNTSSYFALADTALLGRIARGPITVPD
jgi:hypothetical protein